jgi:hypothetical protein
VLDRGLVRVVYLDRVVPAESHLLELIVGEVLHHVEQPRVDAPEVFAHVGARLDSVFLILPVDDFAHPLDQQAVAVLGQQRIPFPAPDNLDHVPARAAERGFELLDDLTVAPDGTVEALQVAVDDEDEVVELLTRGQRDRPERFGLVGLPVADERPHFRVRSGLHPAVLEIAGEARLIDGHQRPEAHRDSRVLPEVRHQPRVGIGRQTAALLKLPTEVLEMRLVDPPFEVRPRVDAGRGVALEEDDVAVLSAVVSSEEVIEADLVQRGHGRVRRDVSADAFLGLVGANDHRRGVPSYEALDSTLHVRVARHERLFVRWNRVDVRGVG